MFKKRLLVGLVICVLFFSAVFNIASAEQNYQRVYFFYGEYCPHCHDEIQFLEKLRVEMPSLEVAGFEITKNKENQELLKAVTKELEIVSGGVPLTIVGEKVIYGFGSENTTGNEIRQALEFGGKDKVLPIVLKFIPDFEKQIKKAQKKPQPEKTPDSQFVKVAFLGEIDIAHFSLPALTVILGFVDGFNPCAMWVLIFLITLLLGVKSYKRRWLLGVAFIFVSGLVYFLFMAAWLNFFLFIGFHLWLRIIIGALAIGMGAYQIRDFYKTRDGGCHVTDDKQRSRIIAFTKTVVQKKSFWLAFGGIIVLAAGVNLIELFCSLGLPAIYTNILSLSALATWKYYAYLAVYILFYMLDDLLIFAIAMITLRVTGVENKYKRAISLIGGLIILIIGILLLLRPEWVMLT